MTRKFLWLAIIALLSCLASGAQAGFNPSGTIQSFSPTLLQTNTTVTVNLVVRNTGTGSFFRVQVGTLPFGWSVTNLTPNYSFIGGGSTRTYQLSVNPGNSQGNIQLPVQLWGDDDGDDPFAIPVLAENKNLQFQVLAPPGPFFISSPDEGQIIEGEFIIGWSQSLNVATYTLEIRRLVGGAPQSSTVLRVTGLTTTSYLYNTNHLIKGEAYQIEIIAINPVGNTKNTDGPRIFSVKPPPPLGNFDLLTPTQGEVTTRNPFFQWTSAANADSYRVNVLPQVNNQPGTTPVRQVNVGTNLSYQWADPPLDRGKNYYVSITAIGEAVEKLNNQGLVRFVIPPISDFTYISPTLEQQKVYTKTSFKWNSAEGADRYVINIYEETLQGTRFYQSASIPQAAGVIEFFLPAYLPLVANKRYSWEVLAFKGTDFLLSSDGRRSFNTTQMSPFAIVYPRPDQKDTEQVPTFHWYATPGALGYIVEVAPEGPDGQPLVASLVQGPIVTDPSWTSTLGPFTKGTTRFWRVAATDNVNLVYNMGEWQKFTIDPLFPFNLTTPGDLSSGIQISPILQWQPTPNATAYRVLLQIPGLIQLPPIIVPGSATAVDLLDHGIMLNGNTDYLWTVEAVADGVTRPANQTWTFTTRFRTDFTGCDIIDHIIGRQYFSSIDRLVIGTDSPLDASYYYRYLMIPDNVACE